MIKKENVSTSSVYYGTTSIERIMKGLVKVYEGWKKLIAKGIPPLTLLNCKGVDLVDYKIYGNSVQDGTPTPTVPVEIQSVGVKTNNLFNGVLKNGQMGWGENSNYRRIEITLDAGTYTISFSSRIFKQASNITFVSGAQQFQTNTFTLTETTDCYFQFRGDSEQTEEFYNSLKVQIEKGDTATPYEPYGKYKIPVIASGKNLVNIPNIKVGDPNVTIPCNLTQNFCVSCQGYPTSIKNNSGADASVWRISFTYLDGTVGYITDDVLRGLTGNAWYRGTPENPVVSITTRSIYIREGEYVGFQVEYGDKKTEYESYVEPITTNIYLDEPLTINDYIDFKKGQLIKNGEGVNIELPNIPTHKGTTILSVDTEILPSNMEVTFYGKSWSSAEETITPAQKTAINNMTASIKNGQLTLKYDNSVLGIDFYKTNGNLMLNNNEPNIDFRINENDELEAIY